MFTADSTSRDKVYVVEDNVPMSRLLSIVLSKHFQVLTFSTAPEAFAYLKYHGIPDLLITDYRLPEIDGYEFVKNISNNALISDIPIFMITGTDLDVIPPDIHLYNVKKVFQKPFEPNALIEEIHKELDTIKL